MNNITKDFGNTYIPKSALLIYQSQQGKKIYVESFRMDKNGCPIDPHPLTINESKTLSRALDVSGGYRENFLRPCGLIPRNVLYFNQGMDGCAIWYSPAIKVPLLFNESLGIPNGTAWLPPLLWKADRHELYIYALSKNKRPHNAAVLFHAPFFNLYEDGRVCMGTVKINIPSSASLEDFIERWQAYFFGSYFSHLISGESPVKGNIVQLWQNLICSETKFPIDTLKQHHITLNKLIP